MHVDSENGWITCPGIKQDSWGQKDHKLFSCFQDLSCQAVHKVEDALSFDLGKSGGLRKGEQESLLLSLVPLSM